MKLQFSKQGITENNMNKRKTIQRQLILNTVGQMNNHPTAEEVYRKLILSYPGISKATVYRNLGTLSAEGLILKISLPDSADKYDGRTRAHYHAVCRGCGNMFDVQIADPPHFEVDDTPIKGFAIEECVILFKGQCQDCKR